VNLYPNKAGWRILDPTDARRAVWDSYNNAQWSPGPPGSKPRIRGSGDTIYVTVDPCDPRLARLGVGTIVSTKPLTNPCLVQTDSVGPLAAYRISRSAAR
jgi:hypothetical protein